MPRHLSYYGGSRLGGHGGNGNNNQNRKNAKATTGPSRSNGNDVLASLRLILIGLALGLAGATIVHYYSILLRESSSGRGGLDDRHDQHRLGRSRAASSAHPAKTNHTSTTTTARISSAASDGGGKQRTVIGEPSIIRPPREAAGASGGNRSNAIRDVNPMQSLLGTDHSARSAATGKEDAPTTTTTTASVAPMANTTSTATKGGSGGGTSSGSTTGSSSSSSSSSSPYAYAFVVGGCFPEHRPAPYRNYIYNILVAAKILRERGSTADIVVLFQIAFASKHDKILESDTRPLRDYRIAVRYIPKSRYESFYRTQMEKFRILSLLQYRRVLFMDADVMPLGNMDYLFRMSDDDDAGGGGDHGNDERNKPILQQNFVMMGVSEPANGGFFMLAPQAGDVALVNDLIQRREAYAKKSLHPYWDPVEGWGHAVQPPDFIEVTVRKHTNWSFHAAFADQGLLYHWTKYVKKSVSIVLRHGDVQNFGPPTNRSTPANQSVVLHRTLTRPFVKVSDPVHCFKRSACGKAPRSDFIHFTGWGKPFMTQPPEGFRDERKRLKNEYYFWWYNLYLVNRELDLGLNFTAWIRLKPGLGLYPLPKQAREANSNLLEPLIT